MAAQHVVDQVRRHAHLLPRLELARQRAFDQPTDDRHLAKRPPQERRRRHPFGQLILEHIRAEQRLRLGHPLQAPHRDHVIAADKPQRLQPRRLHALRQQHPQCLVGIPPGKAIRHHEPQPVALERLDQQVIQPRQPRPDLLDRQPFMDIVGHLPPALGRIEQPAHPRRQVGRQRHAPAHIGRYARVAIAQLHMDIGAIEARHLERLPGKHEAVADPQLPAEPFLDLAEPPPATAPAPINDVHRHRLDDGAAVQPMLRRQFRMRQPPAAVLVLRQPVIAIIGAQRIATRRNEPQHLVEARPRQPGIGRRAANLGIDLLGQKRLCRRQPEQMLRQHIESPRPEHVMVELMRPHRIARRQRFQIFEPIARHDDGVAGLVHAVVGAAGALQQPRRPLRCPHLDHQVDIAPIDAEIEAGGGDDRPQPPRRHGILGLASRLDAQRAMVDADRQRMVVLGPQIAKHQLRHRPRIDEHDRQLRRLDAPHHRRRRPAAIMAGPGNPVLGNQDFDDRLRPRIARHQRNRGRIGIGRQPALISLRIGNRRRQPDPPQPRRQLLQPRQRQTQLVAALRRRKGMDLVDDDRPHPRQHRRRIGIGNQQRQRLRCRQQDLRRPLALALLAVRRRVTRPRLDPDIEPDLLHRRQQVPLHIGRQRLQRRYINRVQPHPRVLRQIGKRRQKPRQRLPRSRRRHQQRMTTRPRRLDHLQLMPPRSPAPRGKPIGDREGEAGHGSDIGAVAGKCTGPPAAGALSARL